MRRSTEFDATIKHGIRMAEPDVIVHIRRGSDQSAVPRLGLIIAKSVGSAVERHRVARRLRHVARTVFGDLDQSPQVVIRALPSSRTASSVQLERQLRRALETAGTRR